MKAKRIGIRVGAAVFAVLSVWWMLYFPYRPGVLYRAIPANAVVVTEHDRLAGRWPQMARHPVSLSLLDAFGVDREDVEAFAEDPNVVRLVDRFASRRTVTGYVRSLGGSGRPAWILASWGGVNAQLLKWGLLSGALEDFQRIKIGIRPAWILDLDPDDWGKDTRLSVSLIEGMLVACLGSDPLGVRHVIDRIERHAPLVPELESKLAGTNSGPTLEPTLDRAWVNPFFWQRTGGRDTDKLACGLAWNQGTEVAGWARGKLDLPDATPLTAAGQLDAIESILHDAPDACIITPLSMLEQLLDQAPRPLRQAVARLKGAAPDDPAVFACVLGDDLSGRILGLKAPTVLLAMQVTGPKRAAEAVAQALDGLNAAYGWSLIPSQEVKDGRLLTVVDSSRANLYSSLSAKDKPALAVEGGWLILSSNLRALNKLLGRAKKAGADTNTSWRSRIDDREAGAFAWIDLDATGTALKKALAIYALALMASNSDQAARTRAQLEDADTWINIIRPLGAASLWLHSVDQESRLYLRVGQAAPAPPPPLSPSTTQRRFFAADAVARDLKNGRVCRTVPE